MTLVSLRHRWTGASEIAALGVVGRALSAAGLAWSGQARDEGIVLVKMHGQEMLAAEREAPGLLDLSPWLPPSVAGERVFPCAADAMLRSGACHGLPMCIHRSNCLWVDGYLEREIGPCEVKTLDQWEDWLQRAGRVRPHPLAVGKEPWQLLLLFECVLLGLAGPVVHRALTGSPSRSAPPSGMVRESLERFGRLRRHVADALLGKPWSGLCDDVLAGRCAVQVMGDWARRAARPDGTRLVERRFPGTAGLHLFNVDYFVPLAPSVSAPAADIARLVDALLSPGVQMAFAHEKGALPAVRGLQGGDFDADGWRLLNESLDMPGACVPSATFDHACPMERKLALAEAVSEFFLGTASLDATLVRLH